MNFLRNIHFSATGMIPDSHSNVEFAQIVPKSWTKSPTNESKFPLKMSILKTVDVAQWNLAILVKIEHFRNEHL